MMTEFKLRKVFDVILMLMAIVAVALWGSSYLRGRTTSSQSEKPTTIAQLEAKMLGTTLMPLSLQNSTEVEPHIFIPAGSPTVLIIFSSTCQACINTVPVWRALLDSLPRGIRTVALSHEPLSVLRDWTSSHRLSVDLVVGAAATSEWGVVATPTTMMVNDSGRVLLARVGILDMGVVASFTGTARTQLSHTQQKVRPQ